MSDGRCYTIYNHRHCLRPGVVQVGGEFYCGIHDPSRIAVRKKAVAAKHAAEIEDLSRRHDRAVACLSACEGVADPQPGELLRLRQELAKIKGGA
jgi:hypothetical protein